MRFQVMTSFNMWFDFIIGLHIAFVTGASAAQKVSPLLSQVQKLAHQAALAHEDSQPERGSAGERGSGHRAIFGREETACQTSAMIWT
jgi:hypothetical protein